jgi:hypothetical protein
MMAVVHNSECVCWKLEPQAVLLGGGAWWEVTGSWHRPPHMTDDIIVRVGWVLWKRAVPKRAHPHALSNRTHCTHSPFPFLTCWEAGRCCCPALDFLASRTVSEGHLFPLSIDESAAFCCSNRKWTKTHTHSALMDRCHDTHNLENAPNAEDYILCDVTYTKGSE